MCPSPPLQYIASHCSFKRNAMIIRDITYSNPLHVHVNIYTHIWTDVKIGGHSCKESLEYGSSKKLFCLTPNVEGPVQILITTLSGGPGTCTVTFYGHAREATPKLGELSIHPTLSHSLPLTLSHNPLPSHPQTQWRSRRCGRRKT